MSEAHFLLAVFVLSAFLGFEVISKVPPILHTPLTSGSNAISGVTIIGALIAASQAGDSTFLAAVSFFAIVFATINVAGGYQVTDRMLRMFRKKGSPGPGSPGS